MYAYLNVINMHVRKKQSSLFCLSVNIEEIIGNKQYLLIIIIIFFKLRMQQNKLKCLRLMLLHYGAPVTS